MAQYSIKNLFSWGQPIPGTVATKINDPISTKGYNSNYLKPAVPALMQSVGLPKYAKEPLQPVNKCGGLFDDAANITKERITSDFNTNYLKSY